MSLPIALAQALAVDIGAPNPSAPSTCPGDRCLDNSVPSAGSASDDRMEDLVERCR
jgi:hypothetical protein